MKAAAIVPAMALGVALLFWPAATNAVAQQPGGQDLFERRCTGCHALDRDKEGPRLRGVYGRRAASVASFEYSEALRKSGLTWDAGTLDKWLADPDSAVPGADMAFHVNSAEERSAIIGYLKGLSGTAR
jgi:cytochrome c